MVKYLRPSHDIRVSRVATILEIRENLENSGNVIILENSWTTQGIWPELREFFQHDLEVFHIAVQSFVLEKYLVTDCSLYITLLKFL